MTYQPLHIERSFPKITRTTLALYADASGDTNPVHIDLDAAHAAGFDDVFVHGMLVMAYMGRAITDTVPPERMRLFTARFVAITHVGDVLTCRGNSGEPFDEGGERRVEINLEMKNQQGEVKLVGRAVCAVESRR
jgi:acyl dehydratase